MVPYAAVRQADGGNWLGGWEQMLYVFIDADGNSAASDTWADFRLVHGPAFMWPVFWVCTQFQQCFKFEARGVKVIFPRQPNQHVVSLKRARCNCETLINVIKPLHAAK